MTNIQMRVGDLSVAFQTLIRDKGLDANQDRLIDQRDRAVIEDYVDKSKDDDLAKELLRVVDSTNPLDVPQSTKTTAAISSLLETKPQPDERPLVIDDAKTFVKMFDIVATDDRAITDADLSKLSAHGYSRKQFFNAFSQLTPDNQKAASACMSTEVAANARRFNPSEHTFLRVDGISFIDGSEAIHHLMQKAYDVGLSPGQRGVYADRLRGAFRLIERAEKGVGPLAALLERSDDVAILGLGQLSGSGLSLVNEVVFESTVDGVTKYWGYVGSKLIELPYTKLQSSTIFRLEKNGENWDLEAADNRFPVVGVTSKQAQSVRAAGAPLAAEKLSSRAIRDLLDDIDPRELKWHERIVLVEALLDDWWVAPVDVPDAGLVADGQEDSLRDILTTIPAHQMEMVITELYRNGLMDEVREKTANFRFKRFQGLEHEHLNRINDALGEWPTEIERLWDKRLAAGEAPRDVADTSGTQLEHLQNGIERASRYVAREFLPFDSPYLGLSFKVAKARQANPGQVTLYLHRSGDAPLNLGVINLERYQSPDLIFKAAVDKFHEHVFGVTGQLVAPPTWVGMATKFLVKNGATEAEMTQSLQSLYKLRGVKDAKGDYVWEMGPTGMRQVRKEPVFELDLTAREKERAGSVERLAQNRNALLTKLGIPNPSVRAINTGSKTVLRAEPDHAELLFTHDKFREQLFQVHDGMKARFAELGVTSSNVEPICSVDGQLRMVLPPKAFLAFWGVKERLPKGADPDNPTTAQIREALQSRLNVFRMGRHIQTVEVDGKQQFSISPELGRLLIETTLFEFHPKNTEFNTTNLYWMARAADELAYAPFATAPDASAEDKAGRVELEAKLKFWGFNNFRLIEKDGAEAIVATNGEMIMVAMRGTASFGDAIADASTAKKKFGQNFDEKGLASFAENFGSSTNGQDKQTKELTYGGHTFNHHTGFAKGAMAVYPEVKKAIQEFMPQVKTENGAPVPVWLAGHSKAGPEVTMVGARLSSDPDLSAGSKANKIKVSGYTVEAARGGDQAYVDYTKSIGKAQDGTSFADRLFLFQLPGDPVPWVPTSKLQEFRHPGTIVMLGDDGDVHWESWEQRVQHIKDRPPLAAISQHFGAAVIGAIEGGLLDEQITIPGNLTTGEKVPNGVTPFGE